MTSGISDKRSSSLHRKYIPAVILVTLAILETTILLDIRHFRQSFREQIAHRDAEILNALWRSQTFEDSSSDLLSIDNPAGQFVAVLETSQLQQLKDLRASRLFESSGKLIATIPPNVADAQLTENDLQQLRLLQPTTRFYPAAKESDFLWQWQSPTTSNETQRVPLLEVNLPIHAPDETKLLGIAQFILDGSNIAKEFVGLDRRLFKQSWILFLTSGCIVVIVLGWAFRGLGKVNAQLSERTQNLLRANQELALAAKTSAVGAVTAHLIHGLKNPLSGLQTFMSSRDTARVGESDTEWEMAVSSTKRMQSLISEIVRVLREENGSSQYRISVEELTDMLVGKVCGLAKEAGIQFQTRISAEGELNNRDANLVVLILENLLHNAIQVTPKGKVVTLSIESSGDTIICEVRDQGHGLSEQAHSNLFKPCQSTKEGGSGIGLAISKQLAMYLTAELELKSSTAGGCVFTLKLPKKALDPEKTVSDLESLGTK